MYILEKDILTNEYFNVPERYADLINGFLFQGNSVITAQDVTDMDTRINRIRKKFHWIKGKVFYRDLLKKVKISNQYLIIGVEEVSNLDFSMPLRIMGYDISGYESQLRTIQKKHRKIRDLDKKYYLSGISKEDRLLPIITIIVYFGEEKWEVPQDLHNMISFPNITYPVHELIPNYFTHVLDVYRYPHLNNFKTDIKTVFEFIQHSSNKESLISYVNNLANENFTIAEDAYDLICYIINVPEVRDLKKKYMNEKGEIFMCQAWTELLEDQKIAGGKLVCEALTRLLEDEQSNEGIAEIKTATKVIRLSLEGMSPENISLKCNISLSQVHKILNKIAA